jgi:hypothetical protein
MRLYVDGPLNAALTKMVEIRNLLIQINEYVEPLGEQSRNQTRLLGEIKDEITDLKELKAPRR